MIKSKDTFLIKIAFKKNEKEKQHGTTSVFDKMIDKCETGGDNFGNEFLDYQKIEVEELMCYLNMAMCGTSNIRFKEKMFYEKLSDAITISEEAFGILVFENHFKRWSFCVKKELEKRNQTQHQIEEEAESEIDMSDITGKIPSVLYQKNITTKYKKETAGSWTEKGYARYNELLSLVRDSRNMSWRKDFEENLQKQYIEKADGKLRAYRKRMKLRDEQLKPKKKKVTPTNMFDSMLL